MLGATMASGTLPQLDGCVSERRDPCASPPCKRLKQDGPPIECIVLEDSTDAPSNTSSASPASIVPANQKHINEKPSHNNIKQNREQSIKTTKCDVTLMETESTSNEDLPTDPPLPFVNGLPETQFDFKKSMCVNSDLLNSSNAVASSGQNGEPSPKLAKKSPPSNSAKVTESGTLFKFLKPVTSGTKTCGEDLKTPSKDNGKTALEDDVIVCSPCTPVNTKISPDNIGIVANGATPSPGAIPNLDTKTTTPRRKTPGRKLSVEEKLKREEEKLRKQKEKEALEQERLEKKKEKERVKEEKQKERMEAKQKKEQEKQEQLENKKQREKERTERKEQEEKERKERLEKKEEEKRKRDVEKKKKEDEKNLKNEEKRKKETEEMLKKEKAKNSFASFFIKKESVVAPKPKEPSRKEAKFQPFELKPFMKLSSTPHRKPLSDNEKQLLSKQLMEQTTTSLRQVKGELAALGYLARVIKLEENNSKSCCSKNEDEVMIIDDDLPSDLKTTETSSTKREMNKVKAKLLQFHQNYRPAYFGSWQKKSTRVGPRTPFKKDEDLLNYDVDSDDEWEEEEPGESLSNSEGEDEEDGCQNDDDDEQDGFFVPHGYLSDDEGDGNGEEDVMDHDGGDKKISQKNTEDKMERHLAKQKTWEAELKRQFKPMKPVAIGCVWDDEIPSILRQLEACCLLTEGNIDPTCAKKEYQEPSVTTSPNTTTYCNTAMPVPEEAMKFLIQIIHGSEAGLQKLIRLFRKRWTLETRKEDLEVNEENWQSHCTVSKRQVEKKITSIANKHLRSPLPKPRWYVHSNILALYKMEDIPLLVNGSVAHDSREKSPSPIPLQTKSSMTTLFSNTEGCFEKANGVITKGYSEKPNGVIPKGSSEKPNGVIAEVTSEKLHVITGDSEKSDVTSMDITPPVRME